MNKNKHTVGSTVDSTVRPNRWPRLVLRTAAAYADNKNTDKYNSLIGSNTVIYGNFL